MNGKKLKLEPGKKVVAPAPSGQVTTISIKPPEEGSIAVEVMCAYRLAHGDLEPVKDCSLTRQFARIDKEGNAEVMFPGDAVRLGDSIMMMLRSESAVTVSSLAAGVVVPAAGPWTTVGLTKYPRPTRRVLREFVLSPERRERVLVAVEEKRLEDARAELVGAVEMADFEEAWIGCDKVREEGHPTQVLGFKPDRTGDFVAPAAYLEVADGAPPAAAAPPFPFRVVEADAMLPVREAELEVDELVRRAVAEGLKLVPAEHIAEALRDRTAHVDLRPLVIEGLLRSTAPEAPDAYDRIAWGDGGVSLEVLEQLIQWRTGMLVEDFWDGGDLAGVSPAVLARALGSDDLASRVAKPGGPPEETIRRFGLAREIIEAENRWRRALCTAAREVGAGRDVSLRLLGTSDLIAALGPEDALRLFDAWDDAPRSAIGRTRVRGPSLRSALTRWASTFGLDMEFAPDVPDLERGEFALALPKAPSVRDLDRSLAGLCLLARREGRNVKVSIDENAAQLRPEIAAVLLASSPESRLRAYLDHCVPARLALYRFVLWRSAGGYTPRVELAADQQAAEAFANYQLDDDRPLGEQVFALRAQGLRLETKGGVLRLVPVELSRP